MWAVVGEAPTVKSQRMLFVRCSCGLEKAIRATHYHSGRSSKCRQCCTKHGATTSKDKIRRKLYELWESINSRCNNGAYAGKYTVSEEWKDFAPFENWAINNGFQLGLTIDRIDGNSGYSAHNCRFATRKQQSHNIKTNVWLTINGQTLVMSEWRRLLGLHPRNLVKICSHYHKGYKPL